MLYSTLGLAAVPMADAVTAATGSGSRSQSGGGTKAAPPRKRRVSFNPVDDVAPGPGAEAEVAVAGFGGGGESGAAAAGENPVESDYNDGDDDSDGDDDGIEGSGVSGVERDDVDTGSDDQAKPDDESGADVDTSAGATPGAHLTGSFPPPPPSPDASVSTPPPQPQPLVSALKRPSSTVQDAAAADEAGAEPANTVTGRPARVTGAWRGVCVCWI